VSVALQSCTAGGSMVQCLNATALLAAPDDPYANSFAHASRVRLISLTMKL